MALNLNRAGLLCCESRFVRGHTSFLFGLADAEKIHVEFGAGCALFVMTSQSADEACTSCEPEGVPCTAPHTLDFCISSCELLCTINFCASSKVLQRLNMSLDRLFQEEEGSAHW